MIKSFSEPKELFEIYFESFNTLGSNLRAFWKKKKNSKKFQLF